jgi:hypothetical protein
MKNWKLADVLCRGLGGKSWPKRSNALNVVLLKMILTVRDLADCSCIIGGLCSKEY